MIKKLSVYVSSTTDPYENLAVEEFLTFHTEPEECILYLWQNAHTVVIGRNQNCWKECRVSMLEAESGKLARRLSGGGAVYHDLGNLNFTFCMRKQHADATAQTSVICRAISGFGLRAQRTGRNDVTVEGRKVSGNAYYDSKGFYYHHGTLLVDTDLAIMSRYLNPSVAKLRSKGVGSVRSRVANLSGFSRSITIESMKTAMMQAASFVYGCQAESFPGSRLQDEEFLLLREKYASWEWKYGQKIPFTNVFAQRFAWGEAQLSLRVDRGRVQEALLSSDSMEADWFCGIGEQFLDCVYEPGALCRVLCRVLQEREVPDSVKNELCEMIYKEF